MCGVVVSALEAFRTGVYEGETAHCGSGEAEYRGLHRSLENRSSMLDALTDDSRERLSVVNAVVAMIFFFSFSRELCSGRELV